MEQTHIICTFFCISVSAAIGYNNVYGGQSISLNITEGIASGDVTDHERPPYWI